MELGEKAVFERNGDIGLRHFGIEVKHSKGEIRIIQPCGKEIITFSCSE
jgi:hypothetical protein